MIAKLYRWLLQLSAPTAERNDYSIGYLQCRVRKIALELCRPLKDNNRVLEVGCGEGLFLLQVAHLNPNMEIWGADISEQRLKQARERLSADGHNNIHLTQEDATSSLLESEYFDVVICINVLFNLSCSGEVKKVLAQMQRVCKKGGRVIFDFRNQGNPLMRLKYRLTRYYDPTVAKLPLRTYKLSEIQDMLESCNLEVTSKHFIGWGGAAFAPIIIIEAKKP